MLQMILAEEGFRAVALADQVAEAARDLAEEIGVPWGRQAEPEQVLRRWRRPSGRKSLGSEFPG